MVNSVRILLKDTHWHSECNARRVDRCQQDEDEQRHKQSERMILHHSRLKEGARVLVNEEGD